MTTTAGRAFGAVLREWRQRRRLSQLALACDADISTRHLSFLETGRSQASREMVTRLADRLDVPLRERNALLLAAGYAPAYPEHGLEHPTLDLVRAAMELVLTGHEPYPAIAIDRHWTLIASNTAARRLLAVASEELLRPPVNVLRLTLHPAGLAPRLANHAEWREHVFAKLRRQIELSGDGTLAALLEELRAFPAPSGAEGTPATASRPGFVVPFQLMTGDGVLSFFSTTTIFGTPIEVTLSELSIESFYPADRSTKDTLLQLAADPVGR